MPAKRESRSNWQAAPPDDDRSADGESQADAERRLAARKKAMDFLARRDYGAAELCGRLRAAGFEDALALEIVDTLRAEGLQDDHRFAAAFLTAKAGRGTGPLRIRQALKEKGVAAAAIDEAFAGDETDWYEAARAVRVKKFGRAAPADFRERARQMRFLQYRGFDYDQIEAAVGHAATEPDAPV